MPEVAVSGATPLHAAPGGFVAPVVGGVQTGLWIDVSASVPGKLQMGRSKMPLRTGAAPVAWNEKYPVTRTLSNE